MDAFSAKNSTGRKVSLLNDGPAPPPQPVSLLASPLTPRLVRSDSFESAYFSPHHALGDQHAAPATVAAATTTTTPKEKSWPCPMAKQYACNDYFTKYSHAARHAKKHTGKKDAYCPECNKAFTRKDAMKRHLQTCHVGCAAKTVERDVKKSRISPISPVAHFMAPSAQANESYMEFSQRYHYPDPTAYSMTNNYNTTT